MNVVGIIAEYNPMHNGHIYNIQKAKELSNADYVVIIMSGTFTQQGNISVINKIDKAKLAIQNGADMVIELPTIFATSSAETFAYGAVKILDSLGIITHLAFGAETQDLCSIKNVANTYLTNKEEIINKIKEYTKQGINSGDAYSKALGKFIDKKNINYSLPNNILAIEYLKALIELKSQIEPVLVHRLESNHNDNKTPISGIYASSTSIRNTLSNQSLTLTEKLEQIQTTIPQNTYEYIRNNKFYINEDLWKILKYEIIKLTPSKLKNIQEVAEGLENKLYKEACNSNSYEEFIFNVKSKRYTLSKIKRICIYILLGITKEKHTTLRNVNYARVLKIRESSKELLTKIVNNSTATVITKVTDDSIKHLDSNTAESLNLDILANKLFHLNNLDYKNKITEP